MPSTGSLLGKINAPKQRGGVTKVARGDPECFLAVRSIKKINHTRGVKGCLQR